MKPEMTLRLIHHRLGRFCTLYLLLEEPENKVVRAWCAKETDDQVREIPCNETAKSGRLFSDVDWMEVQHFHSGDSGRVVGAAAVDPSGLSSVCLDTTDHGTFNLITGPLTILQSGFC